MHEFYNSENRPLKILPDGIVVKSLEGKMEKPSVFIGCSRESLSIAEFVKAQFEEDLYEVDIWDEGIFGSTDTAKNGRQNIHQLKSFTDIYDFAIFIFVSDDIILSQSREEEGKLLREGGTRHNVVFEFGLFLGKIGAKKTYILFDESTKNFLQKFFTDLQDSAFTGENNFIKFFSYPGRYQDWIDTKTGLPYEPETLKSAIYNIKDAINKNATDVDISFLPSTSLTIGYFNSFVRIAAGFFEDSKKIPFSERIEKLSSENSHLKTTVGIIRKKQKLSIVVVMPDDMSLATHETCNKYFTSDNFTPLSFPGLYRPMTTNCWSLCLDETSDTLILYDMPTTLRSSAEAIDMLTKHKDVQELLNEKEKRNFRKVLLHLLNARSSEISKNVSVSFVSWKDFLTELKLDMD